jgi:hypothetical protein
MDDPHDEATRRLPGNDFHDPPVQHPVLPSGDDVPEGPETHGVPWEQSTLDVGGIPG